MVVGEANPIRLTLENRDVAPPYHPYELRVRLSGDGPAWVGIVGQVDQSWIPGAPIIVQGQLNLPANLKPGRYAVSIGLFDISANYERPVEFALQADLRDSEGYYRVTEIEVKQMK
jgi:hypothetical protein